MRRVLWCWSIVAIGIGLVAVAGCVRAGEWTSRFLMEGDELVSSGRNPYFILEPGYQLVLEGGGTQLIITVLNETKIVDGVETRVVEERETKNGQLIEVARNYFAISRRTNDVFRSEEHTSELQSRPHLVCRLLLEKKKISYSTMHPLM